MENIYDDAELYDLVTPPSPPMAQFYAETAGGAGRRVLELCCGSGRITVPLAQSGAAVMGGDMSETMLARARQAVQEAGVAVDFVTLDMRDFELGMRFDAVIITANSIMHLLTRDDIARTLAAIHRHLKPGGRFCFDVFVPSPWLLARPAGERQPVGIFAHPGLGEVTIDEAIDYDDTTQIMHTDWYWSAPGWPDFRHTPLTLRQYYPQELPLLLEAGGFTLSERYGDFERGPFVSGCPRQVCVALKT